MARGRMVNTTIATDKRLASLSLTAEYLYLKTIPHLDRDGLVLGDAPVLWAKVATRRPELLPDTDDLIAEWLRLELCISYETQDGRALFFPNFSKNQIGMRYDREPESTIQAPPGYLRTPAGLVPEYEPETSGNYPDGIRQTSGTLTAEVKRKEVRREGKGTEPPAPTAEFAAQFSAFVNRIHLVASAYQVQEMADRLTTLRERNALDWWDMALKVAEDNNARKWAYVRATLDNCIAAGTPPGAPKPGGKNGKSATGSAFSAYPRTEADDSYEANNTPERLAAAQIEWDRGQAELAARRSAALSDVQGQGMAGL